MGAVDAADYPSRLEYKDNMGPPQEEHMNYSIGAGIPPAIAAQYGAHRHLPSQPALVCSKQALPHVL